MKLIATKVHKNAYGTFLSKNLGIRCVLFEHAMFSNMSRICPEYNGGQWDFFKVLGAKDMDKKVLSLYGAPSADTTLKATVRVPTNGYYGKMSWAAAGIVASLFALNQICHLTEADRDINFYHRLREFALDHADAQAILGAID